MAERQPWLHLLAAGVTGLSAGVVLTLAFAKRMDKGVRTFGMRPHPDWKPGTKQPPFYKHEDTMQVDPAENGPSVTYPLTISAVVPRPIAFISSQSKDGLGNLSPYSYFNAVSHDPPILAIGHCWSKGKPKDSLANILETREFVVAIISDWFIEAANHTCGPYASDLNEMELAGLTPVPSLMVAPPRVGESAVNMECRLVHTYDVRNKKGDITCTVVLGEVVLFHIAKEVASKSPNSGKIIVDNFKLGAISRFGGNIYARVTSFFEIPRPDGEGRYPGEQGFAQSDRDKILNQTQKKS